MRNVARRMKKIKKRFSAVIIVDLPGVGGTAVGGTGVGAFVGLGVGPGVGALVGAFVGAGVGGFVGAFVGAGVGGFVAEAVMEMVTTALSVAPDVSAIVYVKESVAVSPFWRESY